MRAIRLAALATFLLAGGCSLLLETAEPSQCSAQRDCDANPAFRGRVCSDGFCVVPGDNPATLSPDAGAGCTTTEICTRTNSGLASVCKIAGGPCTPWQTPQCKNIHGAWDDPNAIVIGTILPFEVKQANGQLAALEYTDRLRRSIDLALDDFAAASPGGIPVAGGSKRPFAVLHCDSELDPDLARAAMTHLTEVVGVQAIIVGADHDLAAISEQAAAKKTAIACSDCVAPFPPGSAAWRIVPQLSLEAPMAAWRIGAIEAELAAGPSPPSPMKVAVLATPDPGPSAFIEALAATLRFNGKSVADNGSNFTVETTEDTSKQSVNYTAHADALAAFAPDVVVVAMGAEFPAHYLQLLEARWPTSKPKPYYVMTALNYEVSPFAAVIGAADEDVRKRISGTRPAVDPALEANVDAFTTHFKLTYNYKSPDESFSGYDAFYATAFAATAASTGLLFDGPHVSSGFERLRAGTTIDVGPSQLGLGLALLGTGKDTIDLRGAATTLDWDLVTHELADAELGLYCFVRKPDGGLALKPDAGPRLTPSTGAVTGTYSCD